ncbi:MFS transporter [Humibacter sp. BT305]|uniref:MFS transporter n=1 Tax=Cnuibacter physcomitrellae TaxID=1619308 RepID=UPI000E0A501F|nr:MFS transporter [Cnuibacter physcomitrellae]AXH35625.1 MFS transporter [Humibacter sp. BT305]MCS5496519.1 MFS transporter [Cnuibacter physcomitrellae]
MTSSDGVVGVAGAGAEPRTRVGGGWIALFATAWLGVWMAQLTPVQLLLPLQVEVHVDSGRWVDSVVAFGVISAIAGAAALVVFPLTGALSDRTTSRFGRRRPWIALGALVFAVGLAVLGLQDGLVGVGVWWTVSIVGFCILSAALTACISDQVPVLQRGFVSSWISAPQAIGLILGVLLATTLFTGQLLGYSAMAILLVILVVPFLLLVPDARLHPADRPPTTVAALVEGFWVSPRKHPDFGWTLAGRILVNIGNALGTSLLLYFLMFGLGDADAEDDLLVLIVIYTVFVVIASIVCGRLSDRLARRRVFVLVSSVLQAVAALLLALVPQLDATMVAAALLGAGYGCFLSVDQALATQVLPDPASRGKDLGIMNIATAVPQAVAPLVGAGIVWSLGGFPVLFLASAAFALLGALAVSRVRSVR